MGKGPGLYTEIGKKARDLLYKDYQTDYKFTISTYSPTGVAITSTGFKKGELFLGDVNTQLKKKNITTDVKVDTDSNLFTTITFDEPTPGMKAILSFKVPDQRSGKVEIQYLHDYAAVSSSIGLTPNPIVNFSGVIGTNVASLGTELSFDTKTGNFTKCNAGVSYSNAELIASLNLNNNPRVRRQSPDPTSAGLPAVGLDQPSSPPTPSPLSATSARRSSVRASRPPPLFRRSLSPSYPPLLLPPPPSFSSPSTTRIASMSAPMHAGEGSAPAPAAEVVQEKPAQQAAPEQATPAAPAEKKAGRFDKTFEEERETKHALVDMSTIELKAEDLYDKDKVDLEQVELEDVWTLLQCKEEGLTNAEADRRRGIFGPNKLEHKETSKLLQFLSFMWNPLSWVMEGAALVAIALSNGEGRAPDWQDFVGIVLLLFINSAIGFYEENSAGNAVKALMESLAPKAKCRRDGAWIEIESSDLVPGDVIAFKIGDIVPADCRLFDAINVSIDQAGLTGESLPQGKKVGDQCFSSSICKQGEAEGVVIATGANTFFGRAASLVGADDDSTGHLQQILAQIGLFCLVSIGIFIVLEIVILYPRFHYSYRRGLDNILVLLIGGIPIAMPTVLSVTLAVGAQQLAKYKAIVTRITAIEELAGVTILCSDKTGTLTTNKLTIDKSTLKTYTAATPDEVILYAAYASRTENMDAIDTCVTGAIPDIGDARKGIKLLDFKPFNPVDKRTEITYTVDATGEMKRATKGMTGIIIELCTRNKTAEVEDQLEKDVEEFAARGLRALAVAIEDVPSGNKDEPGNGFELIGLLAIFDPPRDDTKQTIDEAQALGVKVKMVTGDQLAIAKETGRRLGLGDHMYPAKVLQAGGFPEGGKHLNLDEMILDADGFAGVFPEHKYEIVKRLQALGHLCAMTGDGANDAPALSRANVGIAVEGATDAARGAADIVLTEPGLSTIVHAIRQSRVIFQRMRNYSIYACAVTIRIVIGFAVMAFAFQFDFPPFMVLIIALLNDGTIMTLSLDRVLPSSTPDSWDLGEIFTFAFAYGLYLAAGTIAFFCVIVFTTFFTDKFGVTNIVDHNDPELHMIIYLQVAQISQALIFITRSHGFFFMERPSVALFLAFCLAQLISSIIAAYGDWGFTDVRGISGGWIGITWIWNIVWFFPLDFVKFGVRAGVRAWNKSRGKHAQGIKPVDGVPMTRTQSRHESLYSNRTSFLRRAQNSVGLGKKVSVSQAELQRFSSHQASASGAALRQ